MRWFRKNTVMGVAGSDPTSKMCLKVPHLHPHLRENLSVNILIPNSLTTENPFMSGLPNTLSPGNS